MNLLYVTAGLLILFCNALADVNDVPVSDMDGGEKQPVSTTKAEWKFVNYVIDSEEKEGELDKKDRSARSAIGNVVVGRLKVYIRYARNLPDTDSAFNNPDPFVRVTAVYDTQSSRTLNTNHIGGTRNPTWNQWLDFGAGRWQCFQISVWDEDRFATGGDDRMTATQLFAVRPGYHSNVRHCGNAACTVYMEFDYNLILDGHECRSDPCQNGGTCHERISSYICSCRNGYVGPQCQYNFCLNNPCRNGGRCTSTTTSYTCSCPRGYGGSQCQNRRTRLRIYARNGHNLPDEDGWANDSDPYFEASAYSRTGTSVHRRTGDDGGDNSPEWYQWLDFGYGDWYAFVVQIWDSDPGNDDVLSSRVTFYPSLGCHYGIRICGSRGCGGHVYFDYCFEV